MPHNQLDLAIPDKINKQQDQIETIRTTSLKPRNNENISYIQELFPLYRQKILEGTLRIVLLLQLKPA